MLKADIEACKEIARHVAREEIAKALADLQKPVVAAPAVPEPEKTPAKKTAHKL